PSPGRTKTNSPVAPAFEPAGLVLNSGNHKGTKAQRWKRMIAQAGWRSPPWRKGAFIWNLILLAFACLWSLRPNVFEVHGFSRPLDGSGSAEKRVRKRLRQNTFDFRLRSVLEESRQ